MISLAMIVKPSDDEAVSLDRCLESVAPYVDEICITVTGTNKKVEDVAKRYNAQISHFDWCDDFSKARNYNFSQCKGDWILWLDADDTLVGGEQLKALVAQAGSLNVAGYGVWYEYNHDENGNCIDGHWKVQLLKNDGHFEWKGAIHEDPIQLRPVTWAKTQDLRRIHHSTGEKTAESYERNLRILLKEQEKNPDEPRTLFYLGRTYLASGDLQKAVEVLDDYLSKSGWDEERYEARLIMGQCYFMSGDLDEALVIYNEAVLEKEDYPDAYIKKGMVYLKKEEWKKALTSFSLALRLPQPEGNTYFNPMLYTRDVMTGCAVAYLNLADIDKAYGAITKALAYDPKHAYSLELRDTIVYVKNKKDGAQQYLNVARYLEETGNTHLIPALISAVPPLLSDDPRILSISYKFLPPKEWEERSIAVYCGNTTETWTPENQLKGGIGGSETAVIELTKRLVEKGWQVTVYNKCDAPPEGLVFDGVRYENYWKFNVQDAFDVLWIWRAPEILDYDLKASQVILDLHDVMSPFDFTKERVEKVDRIFVKTKYHRSLYPAIADEKFSIVGNGIDLARFDGDKKKEPYRFIYPSTPNRGLDVLLEYIWPHIKAELPEAELHVYYGWNTFYKLEKGNPERMRWMKKVQELMKQPGVVDHGRVGQQELASDELKTSYWLYPTYFPEIHCITACEMQAAGVIPITSGYAALAETQKTGVKLEGDVHDPEWQKAYVKEVLDLVKDEKRQKAYREEGYQAAESFSWDNVAHFWHNELYEARTLSRD